MGEETSILQKLPEFFNSWLHGVFFACGYMGLLLSLGAIALITGSDKILILVKVINFFVAFGLVGLLGSYILLAVNKRIKIYDDKKRSKQKEQFWKDFHQEMKRYGRRK